MPWNCIQCDVTIRYGDIGENECEILGELECLEGDDGENLQLENCYYPCQTEFTSWQIDDMVTQRLIRSCASSEMNIDPDIFKTEISTFNQNNCNYKNSEDAFFEDTVCYNGSAETSVLECYQGPVGKYYGKCKYDTQASPIDKDLQTKCVECKESDENDSSAYNYCLNEPVESEFPTKICDSSAGCSLIQREVEERRWENGNESLIKKTKIVQRACKDTVPTEDLGRINIREEVSQCRGDLCNKRKFDPICLPTITSTTSSTTTTTSTTTTSTTTSTTTTSTTRTPTTAPPTTDTKTPLTTSKITTRTFTTIQPPKTTTTRLVTSLTTLKPTTSQEITTLRSTISSTANTETTVADRRTTSTVLDYSTQAPLTTVISSSSTTDPQKSTVSLAIIATLGGTFLTIFIIMIGLRRR